MTSSSVCTLENTRQWFIKAVPNPTSKNISTQMGCHLEEVEEMLQTIYPNDSYDAELLQRAQDAITNLANHMKRKADAYRIGVSTDLWMRWLTRLLQQLASVLSLG